MHKAYFVGFGLVCVALGGCESAAVKKCHGEMESSQKTLLSMNAGELESVSSALTTIQSALAACKEAGRRDEVRDLEDAERNVTAHVTALKKQAERGKRAARTPEQIAELVKNGDPECPKGQGYETGEDKQLVTCTGPQLTEMTWAQASKYFGSRGFKLTANEGSPLFVAEYGADRFVYHFPTFEAKEKARCLVVTTAPSLPWQEAVGRSTGVHPSKLEEGKPVPTTPPTPVRLEGEGAQKTIFIGACDGITAALPEAAAAPAAEGEKPASPSAPAPTPTP